MTETQNGDSRVGQFSLGSGKAWCCIRQGCAITGLTATRSGESRLRVGPQFVQQSSGLAPRHCADAFTLIGIRVVTAIASPASRYGTNLAPTRARWAALSNTALPLLSTSDVFRTTPLSSTCTRSTAVPLGIGSLMFLRGIESRNVSIGRSWSDETTFDGQASAPEVVAQPPNPTTPTSSAMTAQIFGA